MKIAATPITHRLNADSLTSSCSQWSGKVRADSVTSEGEAYGFGLSVIVEFHFGIKIATAHIKSICHPVNGALSQVQSLIARSPKTQTGMASIAGMDMKTE